MSRRDKLIEKMRTIPGAIRFAEVAALLRYEGFLPINQRGSHWTFRRDDGRVLVVVRPHGQRKTCYADDVRKVLEALGR